MMNRQVQRFDKTTLDKVQKTPEGFVVAPMRATRTGVFVYIGQDGKPFRELRHPSEVFNPDSMNTLAMKPITNNHPYELVNSENSSRYLVGYTGENVTIEEDIYLQTMAALTDDSVIDDIESGKVEVSCGYTNELEMTSGWWDPVRKDINQEGRGEKFDAIQRNIRYNHVAVVTRGRAGSEVRLRLDGDLNLIQEEATMKITVDGKEFEVDAALGAMIQSMQNSMKQTKDELETAQKKIKESKDFDTKAELERLEAEGKALKQTGDKLQAKVDELDAQLKEAKDPAKFNARVQERTKLIATADAIMQNDAEKKAELETLDDIEVMKRAIKSVRKDEDLEGKSPDYIRGRFDALSESVTKDESDAAGDQFGKQIEKGRKNRSDGKNEGDQAKAIRMRADEISYRYTADQIAKGEHVAQARKDLGLE